MNTQQSKPRPQQSKARKPASAKPKQRKQPKKDFGSSDSKTQSVAAAYTKKHTTGKPTQYHLPNGDCVIEHEEFIQDINGSVAFTTTGLSVNPGIPETFPWLSTIAPNYESYCFDKLEFEYQNAVGSQNSGTVMLAVDYDASDPAPVSKVQIASYQDYAKENVWRSFVQRNSRQNLMKRSSYYVRTGSLSANQDIKLYDVGNLFPSTQGMADASTVGELYVRYKVRFMTPQIQNAAVGLARSAVIQTTATASSVTAGSNAGLTVTGNSLAYTVTSVRPYNCLVNVVSTGDPGTQTVTLTGTALVNNPNNLYNGTNSVMRSFHVNFLPGQTLIISNTGPNPNLSTAQFAQFNTSLA